MFGLVLGTVILICFALIAMLCFNILNDLVIKTKKNSYANVISHYLGRIPAKIMIQFLIFTQMCSTLLYSSICKKKIFNLVWQFFGKILKTFNLVDLKYSDPQTRTIDEYDWLTIKWRYSTLAVVFLLVLPLNLQKSLANLRYFSIFILVVVFGTIGVCIFQSPLYYKAYKDQKEIYQLDIWYREPTIKWFQGMATMMLSFNCHVTFFYVRAEMIHKTKKRIRKVIRNLISVELLFYASIAISGYVSLGSKLIPTVYTLRRKICKI